MLTKRSQRVLMKMRKIERSIWAVEDDSFVEEIAIMLESSVTWFENVHNPRNFKNKAMISINKKG